MNTFILEELRSIDWLKAFGQLLESKYAVAQNKQECIRYYESEEWENTTLEAGNAISSFLNTNYQNDYQKWNEYANDARQFIEKELVPVLLKIKNKNQLSDIFIDCLKWDIVHIIIEYQYKDLLGENQRFFEKLFNVYKSGHFPCGWTNGVWPMGQLVIF